MWNEYETSKAKDCVSACRRMWSRWMKIERRWSKIDDLDCWREASSKCWNVKNVIEMCPLATPSLKNVQARQNRCEYNSETHIILISLNFSSVLDFQFQNLRTSFVFILKTQWHWSIWISFNSINFSSKSIWLTNDHRRRRLMKFSSFVKKNMLSRFQNLIINEMNELTTMIWLKFLTWLTHHQRILSIYFTSRHRISKTLNYAFWVIFIVFDCVESSITISSISNKLDLNKCGGEENENLSFVKELLLDVEKAQKSQRTHFLRSFIAR